MQKATLVADKFYWKNRIFNAQDAVCNRDNCQYPLILLKERLSKHNVDLATPDIHPIDASDIIIYLDIPKVLPKTSKINHSFLIALESEIIKPNNFDRGNHHFFGKVFTWHDDFIDNQKYFKINYSFQFPSEIDFSSLSKEKFCTLIAGNRDSHQDPRELYSERVKAIRWFEMNHPDQFDLYGSNWDKVISKRSIFPKILKRNTPREVSIYPSYKGKVESKHEILSQYRFSICYENAKDVPGYITEKIFDCLFAGCVPVYLGAPNITDYIPENAFIDKRDFPDYETLYQYLQNMSATQYQNYLNNIRSYLLSSKAYPFSADYFVETIIRNVIN